MNNVRWHTVNYRERDGGKDLFNYGFWLYHLPRLIPLCRLLGHRPVVDGVGTPGKKGHISRWVVCDRCGVRPDPQGRLADAATIGAPAVVGEPEPEHASFLFQAPGPWPTRPEGTIGGQLLIGGGHSFGAEFKVGNPGSGHVLAGQLTLGRLGALYLHTQGFGRGIQRRLNPRNYESRVTGISIHGGRAFWKIWAKQDSWSREDPRWQAGAFPVDPRDILFGPARFSYEKVGDPVMGTVRMPHGDDHPVLLSLQRQTLARRRCFRARRQQSWVVDWEAPGGIPTEPDNHRRIFGSAVPVSAGAVAAKTWPNVAAAAIAHRLSESRSPS